jgi:gamma-glutamyltranspeptidase/glutathione hydrolase
MDDGGTVYLESGFSRETINALKLRGHQIGLTAGGFGGYQAILRDQGTGVYFGASESRKDGHAAGY